MRQPEHRNPLSWYERCLQASLLKVRPATLAVRMKDMLGPGRREIDTPHGRFWIDPISIQGCHLSRQGAFEPEMIETLKKYLRPGSVFIDAGASEGYFTVIGAKLCGAEGRVVAIEPQLRQIAAIEKNIALNSIDNVKLLNIALSDQPGTALMYLAPDINTGSSGLVKDARANRPTQEIAVKTLAQVFDDQGLSHVDLMKMDIESYEYEALLGSVALFRQKRFRVLAIEVHPDILARRGKSAADIGAMLAECGYQFSTEFGNSVWSLPDQAR